MRTKALTSLLLSVFFLCGPLIQTVIPASPDFRSGNTSDILRFGIHVSEMGNLDPHFAAGSQDRAMADMLVTRQKLNPIWPNRFPDLK